MQLEVLSKNISDAIVEVYEESTPLKTRHREIDAHGGPINWLRCGARLRGTLIGPEADVYHNIEKLLLTIITKDYLG